MSAPKVKVIPQKKKLSNNFFFKTCLPMSVLKLIIKKIGHRACLGDIIGQTYPIDVLTGTDYALYFIGSFYILR